MPQEPGSLSEGSVSDEEYLHLEVQHHEFESRLSELSEKAVLTDDEQFEETTLKKKKLQLKDRMLALARQRAPSAHP